MKFLVRIPLLLVLASTFIWISCVELNCKKKSLTASEKLWFSPYSENDTIFFKSSSREKVDTFLLEVKDNYFNKCNAIEQGQFQANVMHMSFSRVKNSELVSSGIVQVNFSTEEKKETYKNFSVFNLNGSLNSNSVHEIITLSNSPTKQLIVFTFEKGYNAKEIGDEYLKTFSWSKKKGLVKYETIEGEVFELIN